MRIVICIWSFIFLAGCVNVAISPSVKGRVIDRETSQPVKADIEFSHNQVDKVKTTISNEEGYFDVGALRVTTPVPFSAIIMSGTIKISAEGYKELEFIAEGYEDINQVFKLESNSE